MQSAFIRPMTVLLCMSLSITRMSPSATAVPAVSCASPGAVTVRLKPVEARVARPVETFHPTGATMMRLSVENVSLPSAVKPTVIVFP